nr:bulb-type lectin domain-containing protein [Tanacetum cinerariifolium]
MVESHNKFLEEYFESIETTVECSLIKGMEDLKMEKEDVQDYIDDEYLSMNGTLYPMKVNTFPRFLSFLDLIKIDKVVYKNWEVLGKKFMEMLEWFYLGFLGQDVLGELPPAIGVVKIKVLDFKVFDFRVVAADMGSDGGEMVVGSPFTRHGLIMKRALETATTYMVVYSMVPGVARATPDFRSRCVKKFQSFRSYGLDRACNDLLHIYTEEITAPIEIKENYEVKGKGLEHFGVELEDMKEG